MPYICDDCQKIYSRKRPACPNCGGSLYETDKNESRLLIEGYAWATGEKSAASQSEDNRYMDHYEELRQSFFAQANASHTAQDIPDAFSPSDTESISYTENVSGAGNVSSSQANSNSSGTDYFSQFQNSSSHSSSGAELDYSQVAPTYDTRQQDKEIRRLERNLQKSRRRYQRLSFFQALRRIPWRFIIVALLAVAVVMAGITIWKMRYVIFESLLSLISGLLPIGLIIWLTICCVRVILK